MSSQAFLWVNVGLGLILILIFIFGQKGSVLPSRLNLRRRSSSPHAPTIVTRSVETGGDDGATHGSHQDFAVGKARNQDSPPRKAKTKDLNVIFLYNGHNFDAYEILGLPAGASLEMAKQGYQTALQKNGSDRLFLEAAFRAIEANKKSDSN